MGVARELRELGARAFPLHRRVDGKNCARARSFGDGGGGEPELVQQRPKLERCGQAELASTPALLAHLGPVTPRSPLRAPRRSGLRSPPAASPGGGAFDGSCAELGSPGLF